LFLAYFIVHLPISLLIDTQLIFPRDPFPPFLRAVVDDWVRDVDDQLVGTRPLWYRTFVWCEMLLHIPYFLFAIYAFARERRWIRQITLVYAAQVLGSMVPIVIESWQRSTSIGVSLDRKLRLQGVLAIWCLIPCLLLIRCWPEDSFPPALTHNTAGKKKQ